MSARKVAFILNPSSGDGKGKRLIGLIERRVKEISKKEGMEAVLKITEKFGSRRDACNLAQEVLSEGFYDIIFGGGDGIFNEGINGIMKAVESSGKNISLDDVQIGLIPMGTGNNLPKNLGIPFDLEAALYTALYGFPKKVDLIKVNGMFVITVVSFGLDAVITEKSLSHGFLARKYNYLVVALKEIKDGIFASKMPSWQIELSGDGVNYQGRVILAAITNGKTYGGIFKISPGAEMTDGKADICLVEEMGPLKSLWNIVKIIRGTHLKLKEVKTFKSSSLTVISKAVLPCEADGEVVEPQKIYSISVLPRKIKIRVPDIANPGI